MAQFNLADYETVEQRHARAIEAYPDLRSVLINHTTAADREKATWVVEARVYLNAGDQSLDLPKATEWAFEIDGVGMANKTSALENANTSALGRALRWALAGSSGPSASEMAKVQRGVSRDWVKEAKTLTDIDAVRLLYVEANAAKATDAILEELKNYAGQLESVDSVGEGTGGSATGGKNGGADE